MQTDEKRLTIREWSEDDRPREKMLRKGTSSLSDAELLAILIGSGNRDESAVELARRIMRECDDNINELARLTIADLCKKFKGIGEAKAISIMAALELGKRRKTSDVLERKAGDSIRVPMDDYSSAAGCYNITGAWKIVPEKSGPGTLVIDFTGKMANCGDDPGLRVDGFRFYDPDFCPIAIDCPTSGDLHGKQGMIMVR